MKIKETFELAFQNHRKNNFQVAEKLYKEIIEKQPDHFGSNFYLGTLSMQTNNFENAINWYEKAIKIDPHNPDVSNNLGTIHQNLRDFKKAMTYYEKAIHNKPNFPDAYNNLGTIQQTLGDFEKAIVNYEKAIQINTNYATAYNNLANVLNELGKYKKAADCCKKAIQINPNYTSAYNNLGNAYKKLKNHQKAIANYEKAIQIDPDYINANNNLGVIYRDLGKPAKAKKYFQKVNTSGSRGEVLECIYFSDSLDSYKKELENLTNQDPLNLRVATIAAYVSKKENIKNIYPFCKNPLDYVFTKNLKTEFTSADDFLKNLIKKLSSIHSVWEPNSKTTEGGYQTMGNLFDRNDVEIIELKKIIEKQIVNYKETFKNNKDFFITKWPTENKFRGWHVKLCEQGHQKSHIHPAGWLSGVFYLKIPKILKGEEGSIKFTLYGYDYPNHENLPSLLHIPKVFDVALFPSSLFHRTIPFSSKEERQSIAFDIVPK